MQRALVVLSAMMAIALGSGPGLAAPLPPAAEKLLGAFGRSEGAPDEKQEAPAEAATRHVRVEVLEVAHDPPTAFVVLLREQEGERIMPVWIGPAEAFAIDRRLSRQRPPRPLTHELTGDLVSALGARIVKVHVEDLRHGVFLGRVYLETKDGQTVDVDARPSDAIALALGAEAPIFVAESVMEQAGVQPSTDPEELMEQLRQDKVGVEL